ncbi:MAG: recombinase family protein [Thermosphaera sp.]|nr:recombinase family protein [Thermosphaera sp.]
MRCVAYVRVSTKEQDEDIQRGAIEDFAPKRGIEIVKWYVDKGESGAKPFNERPGANALLGELSNNGAECVVAWSIDRLGRSMLDTMNVVLDLERRGIRVITVKEEFLQTLDPNIRKLILSILAWVAEYERRRIRERQEEAWRQGKTKGRPRKISDEEIIKYYKTYVIERGISIRDAWKIMLGDGKNISYTRLKQRISALRKQGRIPFRGGR